MDAKVDDWVVTPRHGKPVEIQALWVRSLEVGEALARKFGEADYADRCHNDRSNAIASFRKRFWYEDGGYLYDVIDGPEGNDASVRPNQLYAISLVDELVPHDRALKILRLVQEQLLTPVGLRTLSPHDSRYRAEVRRWCAGTRRRLSSGHGLAFFTGSVCDSLDQGSWKESLLAQAGAFVPGWDQRAP